HPPRPSLFPYTALFRSCAKIRDSCRKLERLPEELEDLESILSDTYFCNFSVFQSLPDSWAIDQLFPILPIHRLDERPTRTAVLRSEEHTSELQSPDHLV